MRVLEGKVAIVTGASGGIGRAVVEQFLQAGSRVVMADTYNGGNDLAGEHCIFVQADVSDESSVQNLVAQTFEAFDTADILVNNAAVLVPTTPVHETSIEEFERLVSVNLRGAFLCCKYFYPHLKQARGCVLNISSMAGIHGEKHHAVYAATKGALNALTQSMAVDYGVDAIRCNALCPSSVLTPNVDSLIAAAPNAEEIIELRKRINCLGYTATPIEIAAAATFLVSPAASFITGAVIPISGGSECGYGIKF